MSLLPAVKPYGRSLRYAWAGIRFLCRSERNMRIHLPALALLIFLGFITGLSPLEWSLLLFQAAAVIGTEAINTALERLTDRCIAGLSETARIVKDLAAAAVLILALSAVFTAALLFIPKWLIYV
ncbi:MAG: diacylglycerol kinase family protein [Chitinophagaceae bacterium]